MYCVDDIDFISIHVNLYDQKALNDMCPGFDPVTPLLYVTLRKFGSSI